MRTLYSWRTRAETYATAPLLALVLLQGSAVVGTTTPLYWTAATANADLMLFIVVPVCAAVAAWEGARHRIGRIDTMTIVRRSWQVALVAVAPTLVMGLLGIAAAVASTAPAAVGAPGLPDPWLIAVYILVMAGHTVVGYGLGRWLPPALALPISLAGSYVWLAYPAAIEPFWIRHLNGLSFEGCCTIDRSPSPRALLATAVFAVALGAGVLSALAGTRRMRAVGGAALTVLSIVAVTVALPLGPSADAPRGGSVRCEGSKPVLCLWPEQEGSRGLVHAALASSYARLADVGMPLPAVVTAREAEARDAIFVGLAARPEPRDVVLSLVAGAVPGTVPDCATRGEWPGANSHVALTAWLALAAGVPASDLDGVAPPELIDLASRVRRLSNERQLAWYHANLAPLQDCTTQPRLDPSAFQDGAR
ncbi:hypothetical protein ABT297_20015 [Dactylosporangium sp. NPDC000555]|uniref:DUF7224 domain-containing protein n=1 Tax=Dactylosporangium sp. NPDC000555 TaxID=3154260 RepID=UPI00332355C2